MILVAYASKHGATRQIADRIAETLTKAGQEAEAKPVREARDLDSYDAFVIGSAAYLGHWLKEAVNFVRRNQAVLSGRPVWLFSSGPLGTEATDPKGQDLREVTVPKEIAELSEAIQAREHRVFFGALDPSKLRGRDRLIRAMPAGRGLLPQGDFRDWADALRRQDAKPHRRTVARRPRWPATTGVEALGPRAGPAVRGASRRVAPRETMPPTRELPGALGTRMMSRHTASGR